MTADIEATAIIRRNGRITIPIELRRQMGIVGGTKFTVTPDGKSIFLDMKESDSALRSDLPTQRLTIRPAD